MRSTKALTLRHGKIAFPTILLRLMIAIGLWQGPLPWWHTHGGLADASELNAAYLTEHLLCWHSRADITSSTSLGWHIHLAYPDPTDGTPQHSPQKTQDRTTIGGDADLNILSPQRNPTTSSFKTLFLQDTCSLARLTDRKRTAIHFFDGFAPTLPLPLRFCIARC